MCKYFLCKSLITWFSVIFVLCYNMCSVILYKLVNQYQYILVTTHFSPYSSPIKWWQYFGTSPFILFTSTGSYDYAFSFFFFFSYIDSEKKTTLISSKAGKHAVYVNSTAIRYVPSWDFAWISSVYNGLVGGIFRATCTATPILPFILYAAIC